MSKKGASIKKIQDKTEERLNGILSRAKSTQGAAARIFPLYQQLQTKRFETENQSEGKRWTPLNTTYAKYKLKRYGGGDKRGGKGRWTSWPGGGRKMLIGTSTLAGAVIGRGAPFEGTDKNVQAYKPYSLKISVNVGGKNAEGKPFNYPEYVAQIRPFMSFSAESKNKMKQLMKKYLIGMA